MAHRVAVRRLALLACVAIGSSASGQQPDYKLEDVLTALHNGAKRLNLGVADSAAAKQLDSVTALLRDAGAGDVTVNAMADLIVRRRATFGDVARWDPRASQLLAQKWFRDAILLLPLIANGDMAREIRAAHLDRPARDSILAPTDALGRRVRELASQQSQEKLRRFEIKYGPESARLNLAEVGLNFVGQWVPPFASSRAGWPSRYEAIAAYRTMELTATRGGTAGSDLKASVVSAGQLGIRWYHWRQGWGVGNRFSQTLRPRQASVGFYALGPRDAPLQRPWAGGNRAGFFLGWGGLHAAYVFDSPRRVLVGGGKQLIPYVF